MQLPPRQSHTLYTPSFIAMAFANLCITSSFGAFFMFPLFIADHGGSQADIGLVMGAFTLSSVLCRPWASQMVDSGGRKRAYTLGSIIMASLPLAYLVFQGEIGGYYLPLLVVRFVHGIGFAVCLTAAFTYVADIVPVERLNEGIGIFGTSGLVGMALGPALGEFLITGFDYRIYFLAVSAVAAGGFLVHLPLRDAYTRDPRREVPSFFSVLTGEKVLMVAMMAFLFGFGLAASSTFVSPFARQRHVSFISLYYITYSTTAVLTRVFGGRFADRVGEARIIPYALTFTGIGLFSLIFLEHTGNLVLSGFMTGCGHGFLFPSLSALAVRNEPVEVRGKITGSFTGSIDAGNFSGSLLLGYVGEWAGFQALFSMAALSLFVGLGLYRFKAKRLKSPLF